MKECKIKAGFSKQQDGEFQLSGRKLKKKITKKKVAESKEEAFPEYRLQRPLTLFNPGAGSLMVYGRWTRRVTTKSHSIFTFIS